MENRDDRLVFMAENLRTPRATKLGIRPDSTVAILEASEENALDLPSDVIVQRQARGPVVVIVVFSTSSESLRQDVGGLSELVFPNGGLWIAWAKRPSALSSGITDHAVRELAVPLGLVDNKACSIDDAQTGRRLVWRRENRHSRSPRP